MSKLWIVELLGLAPGATLHFLMGHHLRMRIVMFLLVGQIALMLLRRNTVPAAASILGKIQHSMPYMK